MTAVLIDTNVLIDLVTADPVWSDWSRDALRLVLDSSVAVINPIVYGEMAAGISTREALDEILPEDIYRREALPYTAAFLAGAAFREYRRRGGTAMRPLADFYIGAHAAVAGYRLLTRDARRYRTAFPRLELISPPSSSGPQP